MRGLQAQPTTEINETTACLRVVAPDGAGPFSFLARPILSAPPSALYAHKASRSLIATLAGTALTDGEEPDRSNLAESR